MKYFIPEWDDRVDPKYDFKTDTHSKGHRENPVENDVYTWNIFGLDKVPIDGVLVSRITMNKKKMGLALKDGIHGMLRLPRNFEIIGDCGAFGYIKNKTPPYDPIETLEFYGKAGFSYGVSVDHLVVSGFEDEKNYRMDLTYQNGIKSHFEWRKNYQNDFQLIVAVQGLEIEDYLKMYDNYIKRDIAHFGFGGLVRSSSSFISDLIDGLIGRVRKARNAPEYMHFFGLSRAVLFPKLKELEEMGPTVGFDSASYLRKAWLSSPDIEMNYLGLEGTGYTAIRIPTTETRTTDPEQKDFTETEKLKQECLNKLRKYDREQESLKNVLECLNRLNKVVGVKPEILTYYQKTLLDKPWKKCDCPICREIGIETIIFRGNNRNRRRGFHNTYAFYNILKNPELWSKLAEKHDTKEQNGLLELKKDQRVLIITGCTKKKLGYTDSLEIEAKNLYQGRLFRNIRKYSESMGFDYVIISAKYAVVLPNDVIGGYEQEISTRDDIERVRPDVEKKLHPLLKNYDKIIVIAGEKYRAVLRNLWDQRFVVIRARGYADLARIVNEAIPKGRPLASFTEVDA